MGSELTSSATVRRLGVAAAVLLSVGLIAGIGTYLARTTSSARAKVISEYETRAITSADLIAGTLAGSDSKTRATGEDSFAGDLADLRAQIGRQEVGAPWYAVLEADGDRLIADPVTKEAETAGLAADAGFRIATRTGKLAFGEVRTDAGGSYALAFQPFDTPRGGRMLAIPVSLADLSTILAGTLDRTFSTSYVVDEYGRIVVSSQDGLAGSPLADTALLAAATRSTHGAHGDRYFVARPVAGSDWRLILTTSTSKLLAPVQANAKAAWLMFTAFAIAMVIIVLIGYSVLRGSARLAQARMHDALTGLPNRALFLERADAVIADWRRKRLTGDTGPVAALFLDLDGFKPVNDTYGHAAGDALLKQVALRLIEATRPEDMVSRFGGDEFLVLCRKLHTEQDAVAVADRIRDYVSEPFEIDGRTVRIGVSIGVAMLDEQAPEAAALIHRADLALYRAKEGGRGRVEVFESPATPEPSASSLGPADHSSR
ncbi:GGDEF domain-containing protein [Paractinoplanes abujensis]|uniref:Diguanylate cyclase (GGDEF)-like protein n=1 Tax=Paractinoplanes abujensis TaxID=882441 RepID=A0A7W7CU37_9ACTN|nr:GGDEF domain-containing protein [Actinoplanes abujensis]MBB4693395.1 diguanylate cyclase (GGDEF)-like protein [Actinoplanes abujensis]